MRLQVVSVGCTDVTLFDNPQQVAELKQTRGQIRGEPPQYHADAESPAHLLQAYSLEYPCPAQLACQPIVLPVYLDQQPFSMSSPDRASGLCSRGMGNTLDPIVMILGAPRL